LEDIIDHVEKECTSATTDAKDDLTGDDHEEGDLKDWVHTGKDGLIVMGCNWDISSGSN